MLEVSFVVVASSSLFALISHCKVICFKELPGCSYCEIGSLPSKASIVATTAICLLTVTFTVCGVDIIPSRFVTLIVYSVVLLVSLDAGVGGSTIKVPLPNFPSGRA